MDDDVRDEELIEMLIDFFKFDRETAEFSLEKAKTNDVKRKSLLMSYKYYKIIKSMSNSEELLQKARQFAYKTPQPEEKVKRVYKPISKYSIN